MVLEYFATNSAARRDLAKVIVLISRLANVAISRALSQFADARVAVASSVKGGFQKANTLSPLGAPSSVTWVNGTPTKRSASPAGLGMVAEVRMNTGSAP